MTTIRTKLKAITEPLDDDLETPEELIAYCARVSNPSNQLNPDFEGLLNYCIRNKHWSIFEMANAVVEVEAPRDITRQLLRHRSFSFQEFSQRYSDQIEFTERSVRLQDTKNRQNSVDGFSKMRQLQFEDNCREHADMSENIYRWWLDEGGAKECARVFLPEGLTMSKLYVNGTIRSWLHYFDVRDDPGVTQWEHVLMARAIRDVIAPKFPTIFGVKNG